MQRIFLLNTFLSEKKRERTGKEKGYNDNSTALSNVVARLFIYTNLILTPVFIIFPILQMRKLKHREAK